MDDFVFFRLPTSYISQFNTHFQALQPQLTLTQLNSRLVFLRPFLPSGQWSEYDCSFQFPLQAFHLSFAYDADDLQQLSTFVGLPWQIEKTVPFNSTFTYLGFQWNITQKTVQLSFEKHQKYLQCLSEWSTWFYHTLWQVQSLYGKLLHICHIYPYGHAYLTGFEAMIPTFTNRPDCPYCPAKRVTQDLPF